MRALSASLFALALGTVSITSGCSRPPPPSGLRIPQGETPAGWPSVLTGIDTHAPALFAGPERDALAYGYLGRGARVRVDGPPDHGRVPVTVGGALVVRGWASLAALGAYAQHRTRVEGTPAYLGQNDLVSLLDRQPDGSFRVSVRPRFGIEDVDVQLPSFAGVLPAEAVGERPVETIDEPLNPGETRLLPANIETAIYGEPNGTVIARIPASSEAVSVVVLRERDGWFGVRAGSGPYIVGYVRGPLAPNVVVTGEGPAPTMPQRIRAEPGALHRVAVGTHVRFYNEDIGTVRREAWARELGRRDDMVDVLVAVDENVAIRGLVPSASLTRASEPSEAPAAQPGIEAAPVVEVAPAPAS